MMKQTLHVNLIPGKGRKTADPRLTMPMPALLRSALGEKGAALVEYIQANGWVCPQHGPWSEVWQALPDRADGTKIGGPVPEAVWPAWNEQLKFECLIRHFLYAEEQGVINQIDEYLRELTPDQWLHLSL